MISAFRRVLGMVERWRAEQQGAIFTEAILVIPFLTFFSVGILEFGAIFWQRQQIETGLRDAGRYLARCRAASVTYTPNCNAATARSIAFFGKSNPTGSDALRVPGWGPAASDLVISPPNVDNILTVSTAHQYSNSPLFGFLGIPSITITATHRQRYIGW